MTHRPANALPIVTSNERSWAVTGASADLVIYRGSLNETLDVSGVRDVIKGGVVLVRNERWVGP